METQFIEPLTKGYELPFLFCKRETIEKNISFVIDYANDKGFKSSDFWSCICFLQNPEIVSHTQNLPSPNQIWNPANTEFKKSLIDLMDLKDYTKEFDFEEVEINQFGKTCKESLNFIQQNFPTTFDSIEILIKHLLFAKRNGYDGGSVSSSIGLIWLSPTDEWTIERWAENIYHEFIHNALFLEDFVNTIFPYGSLEMEKPDGLATSAIRQTKRGYDKSYHSAFVSYGLILFHLHLGNTEKAKSMILPLLHCLDDLSLNHKYISNNAVFHLNKLISDTLNVYKTILT